MGVRNKLCTIHNMENIIEKLKKIKDYEDENPLKHWTSKEKLELLKMYLIICKKEAHIFDLIYSHHDVDSWEDIFRDYHEVLLRDKVSGVEFAIKNIKKYG